MSLSRLAGPPHDGQSTLTHSSAAASGEVPLGFRSAPRRSGSTTGSWSSGTGTSPHVGAVHDRDRAAPEPLTGQQPVAQPEVDRALAAALALQPADDPGDPGRLVGQPVQVVGVHVDAVTGGGDEGLLGVLLAGVDDAAHRQVERLREVQVALVVGGHRHHRAGAVVGQHVVGGPDRDPLAVDRVDGVAAQEDTGLLPLGGQPVDVGLLAHLRQVGLERLPLLGRADLAGQLRVGGHHEERRAVQRVRAGGEHRDRAAGLLAGGLDLEVDVRALGAADPVALHRQHALGPGGLQPLHVVQQPLGVVGDLEVPLGQLALGDLGAAALAHAADDLLVGQHGLVVGAPVDRAETCGRPGPARGSAGTATASTGSTPGRWCAAAATSRSSIP